MAYEIFDDVAFFYLALSVLAMAVLPWSLLKAAFAVRDYLRPANLIPLTRIQKLKRAQAKSAAAAGGAVAVQPASGSDAASSSSLAASGVTQESLGAPKGPWLSAGNIALAVLWVAFILMLLQIPSVKDQTLAAFKPYDILGLEAGAQSSEEDIKKAYRAQSKLFHPDRNPSPEAAAQFLLVAKAYETLTDPKAKSNVEKYGNPDGYQGTKVALGLPSFLMQKENSLRILVVYFFLFIVLPPVLVGMWWRKAKDFVEGGLLKKTLQLWYQFMLPNMGSKALIELLSIAGENEALLGPEYPTDIPAFKSLEAQVKAGMMKQRFQDSKFGSYFQYSKKACVLLHAYLMRIPVPAVLQKDLTYVLKDAHKLLSTLLDLAVSRAFVRSVFGVFDLMQLITQGCFPHDSPLLQLPHITADDVRKLNRKNVKSVHQVLKSPAERLAKILPELTAAQWADIRSTAELIPDVALKASYEVEDEEGLYEGDLVTLRVRLDRVSFDPDAAEGDDAPARSYRMSQFEGDDSAEPASADSPKEDKLAEQKPTPVKAAAGKSNKDKFAAAATNDESKEAGAEQAASAGGELVESSARSASSSSAVVQSKPGRVASSSADLAPMTDDEILDSMPVPKVANKLPDLTASGPSVHSLSYPLPKHERWYVLLLEKSKKADKIIGLQKVAAFFDDADVELKFYAPRAKSAKEDGLRVGDEGAGLWEYEVHAICDSYIGADQMHSFTMKVDKPKTGVEEHSQVAAAKVAEEYKELAEDEAAEEEYGPWYYLYFPTFWELALNIVVLGLLCVFLFNFLHSRGYWQKYVQPVTDVISHYTQPLVDFLYPIVAPVIEPVRAYLSVAYQFCSDLLHRDPFPKHPDDVVFDESTIAGMGVDE